MKHRQKLPAAVLAAMILVSGCSQAAPKAEDKKTVSQEKTAETGCAENSTACETDASADAREGMEEITFQQAIDQLKAGASGIYYFGFEKCPWCQEAVPVLLEEAGKAGQRIKYVKTRDEDKNRLYDDEQKEQIIPYIGQYMKDNDEGELTLYVPLVIRVENGRVTAGHEGTVEGHDAKERKMTDQEREELRKTYDALLES